MDRSHANPSNKSIAAGVAVTLAICAVAMFLAESAHQDPGRLEPTSDSDPPDHDEHVRVAPEASSWIWM
jgi:hypothetical protein